MITSLGRSVAATTLEGSVVAPPSKSDTQRALAAASLCEGRSRICNPSASADAHAAMGLAEGLGATITREADGCLTVRGAPRLTRQTLSAGEAGLSFRLFAPILALFDDEVLLTASGSLRSRPMGMLEAPLVSLGAKVGARTGLSPLLLRGPMRGGEARVDGRRTSQHISGLLMATPRCPRDSVLSVQGLRSGPYVSMTLATLAAFGIRVDHDPGMTRFEVPADQRYRPTEYTVEGDWSGAAFLLVAGALAGAVQVRGLAMDSRQPDRRVIEALELAGASISTGAEGVRVAASRLRGFRFDATDCPDLIPPLAALAARCDGTSVLLGAGRLRDKESDRGAALAAEFGALGVAVEVQGDTLRVVGGRLRSATCDAHGDHRIAMAVATASMGSNATISILGWRSVDKSYPRFFEDLSTLGARIR